MNSTPFTPFPFGYSTVVHSSHTTFNQLHMQCFVFLHVVSLHSKVHSTFVYDQVQGLTPLCDTLITTIHTFADGLSMTWGSRGRNQCSRTRVDFVPKNQLLPTVQSRLANGSEHYSRDFPQHTNNVTHSPRDHNSAFIIGLWPSLARVSYKDEPTV